ncbi:MAG: SulP family inorganic anion transporter [Cytophagaceae bacterium]
MSSVKNTSEIPATGFAGLLQNWKADMLSGFLVFLIALPLCLGIAMASGFPPIAGIMTAVVGGIIVTLFQGAHVAIKGPAAGLIVIVFGAVESLGKGDAILGYKLTLAVIVASGIIQVLFGLFRTGVLGDFFPSSAVHGMLAAIGIIIASKQVHTLLGVKPEAKSTLGLIAEIPQSILSMNPWIAVIGIVSLLILFLLPLIKNKWVRRIPGPMLVILVAIPLGHYFGLANNHVYLFLDQHFEMGPNFLVTLPDNIIDGFAFPDFSQIFTSESIYWIIMFALVGSLESLLSNKAVDILDPYHRKSALNKDLVAVGIGNTICGFIGALPMISEIVRSSANINNGAKTKWSNWFHGMFLLGFVALAPGLIHQIPLAALAAMLIFTGFRLASPKVFVETYKVGKDQLTVFVTTLVVTLASDLIIGIFSGIAINFFLHLINGAPPKSLFSSQMDITRLDDSTYQVKVHHSAIFSNFISFKNKLDSIPQGSNIALDFSRVKIVDHSVMEHLHHYGEDYLKNGGQLRVTGMGHLKPLSKHPLAVRIAGKNTNMEVREHQLKNLAEKLGLAYYQTGGEIEKTNFGHFSFERKRVRYEGNVMKGFLSGNFYRISDISVVEGGDMKPHINQLTVISVSQLPPAMPAFTLGKEKLIDKVSGFFTDIDFKNYPKFSQNYLLNAIDEKSVRKFFNDDLLKYLENNEVYEVQCLGTELIFYKNGSLASPNQILEMLQFAKGFIQHSTINKAQDFVVN